MANDLAQRNVLSHIDSQGRDPGRRNIAFGYTPYAWTCELALGGTPSGETAFFIFKGSPSHVGCLFDPKFVSVGIGRAYTPASDWRWVIAFGSA
jgi:uncharacterized protein YkwD